MDPETPQAPDAGAPTEPEASQTSTTFTQEDLDKIAGYRAKEAEQRVINNLLKQAEVDSVDDLLEGYQTYRTVQEESETEADNLRKKLEKLQPKAEQADSLEEFVTNFVEKQKEGLPDHLTALLNNMSPLQQAQWLNEHGSELEQAQRANVGGGSNPANSNSQGNQVFEKNPFKKDQENLTEQGRLIRTNPTLAGQMMAAAGFKQDVINRLVGAAT